MNFGNGRRQTRSNYTNIKYLTTACVLAETLAPLMCGRVEMVELNMVAVVCVRCWKQSKSLSWN
jgi:hypothetical protein